MNKDKEYYLNLFLIIAAPIVIVAGVLFIVIPIGSSPIDSSYAVAFGYLLICLGVFIFILWLIRILTTRSNNIKGYRINNAKSSKSIQLTTIKGGKDFKRFCNRYVAEKCECDVITITVLTGHRIGGASKSHGEEYYSSIVKGLAYINEKNELIENEIRFTYFLDNKPHMNFLNIDKLSIYKFECKKIKDSKLYYLLKIKRVKDNRFDEIVQEQLKPIIKVIDGISFKFDRVFSRYEGHLELENKKIEMSLEPDRNSDNTTNSIETYKKIKSDFKSFYDTILKKCSEGIVKWANDWKNDDDEHEIITTEIEQRIDKTNTLPIDINGNEFTIYFDDDDLFLGHTIVYYGNIEDEKYSVDIAG